MRPRWLTGVLCALAVLLPALCLAREVSAVRMSSTPENTRLVFDLDGPVEYTLATLDGPRRVVIEMRDTLPGSQAAADVLRLAGSSLTALRSARQPDGSLRWVLELRGQQVARAFALPPSGSYGHRLVVDVGAAGGGVVAAAAVPAATSASAARPPAIPPDSRAAPSQPVPGPSSRAAVIAGERAAPVASAGRPGAAPVEVSVASGANAANPGTINPSASAQPATAAAPMATVPAQPRPPEPAVVGPAQAAAPPVPVPAAAGVAPAAPARAVQAAPVPQRREPSRPGPLPAGSDIVFAIDAGHGGQDPGAVGADGVYEKDIVLAIARRLAQFIDAEPGFKAVLTRTGDYFIPLRERTRLARAAGAHFFVSVHADAALNAAARGASVYALSERGATSETAKWLADRENNVDLVGGVSLDDKDRVLAGVLLDLSMTASLTESLELGGQVLEELGDLTRLHSRRVEQAGFMVLKSPDIPSILVETGFVSNAEDARNLATEGYRERVARAIFRGVREQALARPPSGTAVAQRLRARVTPVAAGGDAAPPAAGELIAGEVGPVAQAPARTPCPCAYVVVRGDTLSSIAERFRVPERTIRRLNEMRSNRVRVGQTLRIPAAADNAAAARES